MVIAVYCDVFAILFVRSKESGFVLIRFDKLTAIAKLVGLEELFPFIQLKCTRMFTLVNYVW